jgi:hypothetical protein
VLAATPAPLATSGTSVCTPGYSASPKSWSVSSSLKPSYSATAFSGNIPGIQLYLCSSVKAPSQLAIESGAWLQCPSGLSAFALKPVIPGKSPYVCGR